MRFSKIVVLSLLVLTVIFTAIILYIFYQTGQEPETLVRCWFVGIVGELGLLAKIKWTEIGGRNNNGGTE